jgi:hypothetical protein
MGASFGVGHVDVHVIERLPILAMIKGVGVVIGGRAMQSLALCCFVRLGRINCLENDRV